MVVLVSEEIILLLEMIKHLFSEHIVIQQHLLQKVPEVLVYN